MQHQKEYQSTPLIESLLLAFIWLVVFASPLIAWNGKSGLNWAMIQDTWIRLLPFLLLSLLNHFVLVPFLLFKKTRHYVIAAILTLAFFSLGMAMMHNREIIRRPLPPDRQMAPPGANPEKRPGTLPPFMNTFLISFLILGGDSGMRSLFRGSKVLQEKEILEKEKVKSELAFLRNQISPHFFMNTLNNIHSLIDLDTEEAKNAVIRLSKLMQHLLYDSALDTIPLKNEIAFIQSYIELMKLRYSEKVKITLDIHSDQADTQIPPMLFTSLLENAFKYGISYKQKSFIDISLVTEGQKLVFKISNSIIIGKVQIQEPENSGIGLENTRKRLNLLYGEKYQMDISENGEVFNVTLILPL